jgi:PIN domain nuclease of toxin-antitoxin system
MVIDASALLALIFDEAGAARVKRHLDNALLSAVNAAEVVGTLVERGMPGGEAERIVARLVPEIVAFDTEQAFLAGSLRLATRQFGLSLGDRACLALAIKLSDPVLTADRTWTKLSLAVKVNCIR